MSTDLSDIMTPGGVQLFKHNPPCNSNGIVSLTSHYQFLLLQQPVELGKGFNGTGALEVSGEERK
jgi:hypothetical protein